MGLLDDDPELPYYYTPPKSRMYVKQTVLSQEARDLELNNHDREVEDENYRQPE